MTTLLVANRGEIALRISRTARRMGMRLIAVYSEADAEAPFVGAADLAIPIGPAPARDSYLRIERIIEAAKESGADLVHPGYGFLAEEPDFAEACERAGVGFVGPPSEVLRRVGAKDRARRLAEEKGVPVLPGYAGELQSDPAFLAAAGEIGYPVMVKPAEGGGGKGMGVAGNPEELEERLASARRLAAAAFGDERLMLERYLAGARHVEVQVIADHHGSVVHLGERDCSIQRRYQKIVEESPSPGIDQAARERLFEWAVALAGHAGYRNAGTFEFLAGADGTLAFLEVNARLQVEHPVTEMVTGLDLVELQLRVAMGERLPLTQEEVSFEGHAVEARVYAEDPAQSFLPQAGRVVHVRWPSGEGVRVDTGIVEGSVVSTHYDPMIAKVIAAGPDRPAALDTLDRALADTQVLGVRTNLDFLRALLPALAETRLTDIGSGLVEAGRPPGEAVMAVAAAAEADRLLGAGVAAADPWARLGGWRPGGEERIGVVVRSGDEEMALEVGGRNPYLVAGHTVRRLEEEESGCHAFSIDGVPASAAFDDGRWFVWWEGVSNEVGLGARERTLEESVGARLEAPMPGQVIKVRVTAGESVAKGRELVVVEAMKMEHSVRAPADGVVTAVLCAPGDRVERGQTLVEFEPG